MTFEKLNKMTFEKLKNKNNFVEFKKNRDYTHFTKHVPF